MHWTRTAVVVVAGTGAVWAGGVPSAVADGPGDGSHEVHLLVNGAFGNRPGELIDIEVQGVRDRGAVTVTSPVFRHRVRLAPHGPDGRAHHARPAVAMTVKPGTYPLTVHAGGRVVAEDRVEVRAPRPAEFRAGAPDDVLRPGERLGLSFDDLRPGATGDVFTAVSPAFRSKVRLTHDPAGSHWNNPRMFTALVALPPDVKDGTYKVTLTGADGRRVQELPLVVRAARPGDGDYVGRVRGPAFFAAQGRPEAARAHGHKVAAGGKVNVLWRDSSPDPGEEERLTATSPAFERPVPLRRDAGKAGDGDVPRYYGPARVRSGLAAGRYPVTVISHHGRVKRTGHLVVTGAATASSASTSASSRSSRSSPASSASGGPDRTMLIAAGGAGLAAATAAAVTTATVMRRRARRDG
ncbi:hypothetical protein LE181_20630 [Streptomyces sp. SCA3-4]|uniref:hypothetical protein n=1 Tax=Streptomyces sichuanensis TaxID=2871810 RepID=UPI001CE2981C|nr:hypothetical protein [Streptomyces sichuanensis]MCA6094564.1 hypothetical protein [Streptomyces sichuanensis]